jgi:hypothetical protein
MPYWLTATLAATPAFAWVFLGLGLPWALVLLPRSDWRDRPLVACVGFVFGPGLLTAWMFVLSQIGAGLLRFDLVFAGTVVLALLGGALAWRKRAPVGPPTPRHPLAFDEKLLLVLIGVALVVRWLGIAYWPFTAYDALWVYGYEGRLYTLLGDIPNTIGYYPQFLPLQFTYGQLAYGAVNDHAARAVLIFLHSGAILSVYVLGSRLFNRRIGIFAAALWALYPHVGEWSRFGDLEIPLTMSFTAAAAFFLMAWFSQTPRRRYALIAGLMFGVAMWTKPTAGAFVWGVLLLLVLDLVRVRFDLRAWLPRFEVAVLTGLAAAPLGVAWYVRNLLLGLPPLVLPPGYWQTLAQQSGVEFGWPLLGAAVSLAYLYLRPGRPRPPVWPGVAGVLLVAVGFGPSIVSPHPITLLEWLVVAVGGALLLWTVGRFGRNRWGNEHWSGTARIGWILALAFPYFVTWFVSYSYHYRLSFAIVPLMLMPTAVTLGRWWSPALYRRAGARWALGAVIVALSLSGILIPLYDTNAGWDWLWTDTLPDDFARYESGNSAMMTVVAGLQIYLDEHEDNAPLVVVAPGVKRLPFFFPLEDIRTETTPTRFDELDGVVYFIDSEPEGVGQYESIPWMENQVLAGLKREDVMRYAWGENDGIFRYDVYELHLADRFEPPAPNHPADADVVFGGFARYLGHDIGGLEFWVGRKIVTQLFWEVVAPAPEDYTLYVHLQDAAGNVWATWDGPVARTEDGQRYYTTLVWEPGEYIDDERVMRLREENPPVGEGYRIVIGYYNIATGVRVPVTVDGVPAGEGYALNEPISVVPAPED